RFSGHPRAPGLPGGARRHRDLDLTGHAYGRGGCRRAGYHGYWPQDFGRTNPHFGDLAGLRELVGACHQRRINVILDIVVNHIGQLFYYDINLNGRPDETVIGTGSAGPLGAPGGAPVGHVTEFDPDFDPRGVQAATALGPAGPAPIRWLYEPAIDRMPPQPALFQNPDFYH